MRTICIHHLVSRLELAVLPEVLRIAPVLITPLNQEPGLLSAVARGAGRENISDRVLAATANRHDMIHRQVHRLLATVGATAPIATHETLPITLRDADATWMPR